MNYTNVNKILAKYPTLSPAMYNSNNTPRRISGDFIMNTSYEDVYFCKMYHIDIDLSTYPPGVKETGNMISRSYPHRYDNGELCLEAPARIKLDCIENNSFNFEKWFNSFLIPYFFTYEFYKRFCRYPFGERSHGERGILECYAELLHLSTVEQTKIFLQRVSKMKDYRGHHLCPCGSERKIRDCHKEEIVMALRPIFKECIEEDLERRIGR